MTDKERLVHNSLQKLFIRLPEQIASAHKHIVLDCIEEKNAQIESLKAELERALHHLDTRKGLGG